MFVDKHLPPALHVGRRFPLACTTIAALVLHAPGLSTKIRYSGGVLAVLSALIGAITEGFLFFILLSKAVSLCIPSTFQTRTKTSENVLLRDLVRAHRQEGFWSFTTMKLLLALALLAILVVSFVVFSVADYTFQTMSGGLSPSMWVVVEGIQHAAEHAEAQFARDGSMMARILQTILCLVLSVLIYAAGQIYCYETDHTFWGMRYQHLTRATKTAVVFYGAGAWSPVLHAYLCFYGSFVFVPDGFNTEFASGSVIKNLESTGKRPNVILLMHESLSGAYALDEHGKRAFRFLQEQIKHNDDWFLFENSRSVSGDTTDAMTAIVTGCLAFTDNGKEKSFGRSVATEFKRQGYRTGSFSSRTLDLARTKWFMLQNYLTKNFDVVYDPLSQNLPRTNAEGADDRSFVPLFKEWVSNNTDEELPFFAQFYQFNTHWPYVQDKDSSAPHRYYSSMETTDGNLRDIVQFLNKTGKLDDTVIIASGDHGEHLTRQKYTRLSNLNSYILHPLTYMYVPKQWFSTKEAREILKENQNRMISTLDLYPTIQNILYGGDSKTTSQERNKSMAFHVDEELEDCISGQDLMSTRISDDRVALSWNTISHPKGTCRLAAISNAEETIYYKKFRQKTALSLLHYGNCTNSGERCIESLTEGDRDKWKKIITSMYNSSFVSKHLMQSDFIKYFSEELKMS